MKKFVVMIIALFATGTLFTINVDAQWRSETHDVYNAPKKSDDLTIDIDGVLNDEEGWEGVVESVLGTNDEPFCEVEFAGNDGEIYVFREWSGGIWNNRDDHRTCFAIVWEPDAIYLAIAVTDDEHQNGGAAWNGDSAQIGFEPTGMREAGLRLFLYNAAISGNAQDIILHNESTHGSPGLVAGQNVAITRNEDDKETYYEYRFSAEELQIEGGEFSEGYEFGFAVSVNDGDSDTPGQKGWSGWYTDCIVNGPKQSENTGLVILSPDPVTSVEPDNKATTTWGRIKSVW